MTAFLLSVHVVAAILFVGPVTVATSLFPRYVRAAAAGAEGALAAVELLHRISRVYAVLAVSVPVFGMSTGSRLGVLTDPWLIVSIALTAGAAALLALAILPGQTRLVAELRANSPTGPTARLAGATGIFALTWVIVTVLMIARPGSTTGV